MRTQISGIEDLQPIELLLLRSDKMLLTWSMARFATNTRGQLVQLQLQAMNGASRVATKALLRLFTTDRAAERIFERRRHGWLMPDGEVELPDLFKVTYARFVEGVVVPEQVSLPDVTLTKTIKDRLGNAFNAVTDGVND